MADFFDTAAELGSEEEDEDFDEETGEVITKTRKTNGKSRDMDDSSEEEEEDDEEAERAVREGFIVDEEEEDDEATRERKRERKKRRREEREAEELDEEDLDLIGETHPDYDRRQAEQSKFKRLKRGHREDRAASEARGVEDIFSDEEEGADGVTAARRPTGFGYGDEMDDFIEQDEFPDEEQDRLREDLEIRQPNRAGFADLQSLKDSGLDEADMEDMRGAFGDGQEFEWALDVERQHHAEDQDPDKVLELKDVFEPSQLIEKMLTDDDNIIRTTDVPERYQIARKPYVNLSDLPEEVQADRAIEEAKWIANLMFPRQRLPSDMKEPFQQAVQKVLNFINVEDFEPAYIFQNKKDYLIHSEHVPRSPDRNGSGAPDYEVKAEKLLNQTSLWELVDTDLKYRAFWERREGIAKSVQMLKEVIPDFEDAVFTDLLPDAVDQDELQDIQEYINFQYSQQLADLKLSEAEASGQQKRARGTRNMWDKVRSGPAYHLVRAFGISADAFAQNAAKVGRRNYTDDPDTRPDDLADTLIRDPDFRTGQEVLNAARAMIVEEIVMSPRMRKHMRKVYVENMVFDVHRTEKGLKQIDEEHPYYEFKYLRNAEIRTFVDKPELFLRMLKAEQDGLVEVKVRLQGEKRVKDELQRCIESDNFSEVADAWNTLRREVLDLALKKLHRIMTKGWKENLKNEFENKIAQECRDEYSKKLDQAPYKPKGMQLGTTARVLALSNGAGNRADAICWAYIDENGRVLENGKFADLRLGNAEKYLPDGADIAPFVELAERRKPDVVAVSGWSVETRRLYKDLQDIIDKHELRGTLYEDEDDREVADPLEVVIVNDEIARLYHTSDRSNVEHPGLPPLTRYCIALGRYMQNPLTEYAALGRDIKSISFDPNQNLIPEEKLIKHLETAMVDMVNLVGLDINEAVSDGQKANLLPYVCGLGPRKAAQMLKVINQQHRGEVSSRSDLVGDPETGRRGAVGPKVWLNCASFLYIPYEATEVTADYLDNTRIHPEDYDIARKMAADALELDEEDVKAEVDEHGESGVIRRLVAEENGTDKVNDLILEQYAEQLESKFGQRKRATLETIRAELQNPYEELRRNFTFLRSDEIFTMLTGETEDSLTEGMIVPVSVKRTFPDHIEVKLDCGIDGGISDSEFPEDVGKNNLEARQVWSQHQTVQAKIMHLDRKKLTAQLTMREGEMRNPRRKEYYHGLDEWDEKLEEQDRREAKKAREEKGGRAQRVIKHPLFRPFNSSQAESFLAPQGRGDCVVRPSSKGLDHLAVTWKVHDDLYQHLDVLELDKENEFSVGRTLRVGKLSYSDLDELIVLHVKAMAKKVDEMMGDDRYQPGSKAQTGKASSHHHHRKTYCIS